MKKTVDNMEIIQYVKWTKSGEKDEFLRLAKQYPDNNEFISIAAEHFQVDKMDIRVALLRYKEEIQKVRN